jgi:hypothetical protein
VGCTTRAVEETGAFVHEAHPRFAVRAGGAELRGETPQKSGDIARVESVTKLGRRCEAANSHGTFGE